MYESMAEQYLVEIMGIKNPTEEQLDQVSVLPFQECKPLVVGLAQFMDFGAMMNPSDVASLETLKDCLIALQSRQLIDVIEFDEMNSQLVSKNVSGFFEPQWLLFNDYYIVFQNLFDMYINAYNADAHLRDNPAICNDGHISSSGSLNNYETKMGKKWQQSYGIESDRGVCTKHDGVKEMISLSKYKKMKPKAVKQFDPDFEGDDDLVTYRSSRQPSFSKAQQIAKAKKEKAKAKKAKAKAKKNPMVSASDWMQWANGYGLDYTVDDYMDEGVGELLIHFDADQDVDGTIMSESIAMGGSITGGYHTGGQMTIHTDVYVDA